MDINQDLFISHAGADKQKYVYPIANSFRNKSIAVWLDDIEISWGDSIAMQINNGLRSSRFVLLCLSPNFCDRPWPESELSASLAMQNSDGKKRVLPLILEGKEDVLNHYPLLSGFAYREYAGDPNLIATEVSKLLLKHKSENLEVIAQTVHTGRSFRLVVPAGASNLWVTTQFQEQFNLRDEADTGGFARFGIRWVLVDARVKDHWEKMPRYEQEDVHVIVLTGGKVRASYSKYDKFSDLNVESDTVFYLYAIQDSGPVMESVGPVD